jgi:hypothetical protein
MNPIAANDPPADEPEYPYGAQPQTAFAYRASLPDNVLLRMRDRALTSGQDINALYQNALDVFARNLTCGVRMPLSATGSANLGVLIQLPEERRGWLRRLALRLSLSEGDVVAAAAEWWLGGGVVPRPSTIAERPSHPSSTHDPPS